MTDAQFGTLWWKLGISLFIVFNLAMLMLPVFGKKIPFVDTTFDLGATRFFGSLACMLWPAALGVALIFGTGYALFVGGPQWLIAQAQKRRAQATSRSINVMVGVGDEKQGPYRTPPTACPTCGQPTKEK